MNKKILVALSLILLGVMVNAHTLEGNFEGLTFQGETVPSIFHLCNSSDSGENFNISTNNIWMQLRPLSVYINGNSCKEIYAFTTPFPYAESGKHEITVTAKGETDTVSRTFYLTVVEGHKISVNSNQNSINSTQCQKETFEIELKNTGIFDERALISVQGINPNWISLSSEEILLPKNTNRNFELEVLIPCSEETKKYEFTLLVELKNTGIIKEKILSVNVEDSQGIGIESKSFNACNDLKTQETLIIKNSGILSDSIKVELEGLNWIALKENSFSLNPGKTTKLELEFNGKDLEKGNYNFTVKIYSEKFNKLYSKEFSVKLEDCFNLEITKGQFQDSACIESTPEISFIIKNTGARKANVKAGIEGINAVLEKNSIALNPGESTEIKAKLNFNEIEQEGKVNFIFLADSENYSSSLENSIEIQNCYETEAVVPVIEVCNEVQLTGKFIVIKNTGTRKQSFEVSSDLEWIKLEETSFELEGNQEKTIGLIITPRKDSREESYSIKTKTENNQYQLKAGISYPNQETCFGISMTNLKSIVDVNAGEGSITTIKVTNNGRTVQNLEFSVDNYYWVYFNPKEFDLMENETKEVYVYFNPPFDFKEETVKVKVKATTNFGYKTEQEVQVNISGGSVILTINPEDIKVNQKELGTEDTNQNNIEIKIEITNNTETNMKILDIKSNYPNSKYFIEDPIIKKGTASEAKLSFTASTELDLSGLEVPIEIITDKGTYYKVVILPKKETETEKEAEGKGKTGFVLFGGDEYILVILIVIVVILIIMAAVRTGKEEEKEEIVDYSEEKKFEDEIKEIITKPAKTEKTDKAKPKKNSKKKKK